MDIWMTQNQYAKSLQKLQLCYIVDAKLLHFSFLGQLKVNIPARLPQNSRIVFES